MVSCISRWFSAILPSILPKRYQRFPVWGPVVCCVTCRRLVLSYAPSCPACHTPFVSRQDTDPIVELKTLPLTLTPGFWKEVRTGTRPLHAYRSREHQTGEMTITAEHRAQHRY